MSKDDFHVIAYRILKYLYETFKQGELADLEQLSYTALEINERYFNMIMLELLKNGFIEGVDEVSSLGSLKPQIRINRSIHITLQGIEYLTDNSTIAKAKRFLQDVKSVLPSI